LVLPPEPHKPRGGRPRIPDRAALTGIPRQMLTRKLGCRSGMTCRRRLRDRNEAGVWKRLHKVLLDRLGDGGQPDWSRAAVDARRIPDRICTPDASAQIVAKRAQNAILR